MTGPTADSRRHVAGTRSFPRYLRLRSSLDAGRPGGAGGLNAGGKNGAARMDFGRIERGPFLKALAPAGNPRYKGVLQIVREGAPPSAGDAGPVTGSRPWGLLARRAAMRARPGAWAVDDGGGAPRRNLAVACGRMAPAMMKGTSCR